METLILATSAAAPAAGVIGPPTFAAASSAAFSTVGSLLSGGLTAASAFGSIMGGQQQNAVYQAQARQSELAAKQEELKGREQADKIRRSLQATLASQNAAFAARGISLTSGTPVKLANVSSTEAAQDIENAQFGASMAAAAERGQAGVYRMSGKSAITSGYANAAFGLYGGKKSFGSLL